MKRLHLFGASILGAIVAFTALGAVYNQFSPGGALSGTWNSQNVNLAAGDPFITGVLPVANGGTDELSGTFTATFSSGFTASQTQNFTWTRNGDFVNLRATSAPTGTSNATNMATAAGELPAALRPLVSSRVIITGANATDNGSANRLACLQLDTDGMMRWGLINATTGVCGVNGWTNSGTKTVGVNGQNIGTYSVQ